MRGSFNHMSIQSKLFGILAFIIMIGTVIMMWNVYNIIQIDIESNHILKREQELDDIGAMQIQFLKQEIAEKDFLLSGNERYLDRHEAEASLGETHLREALLSATTNQERSTLYSIQRQAEGYEEDFAQVIAVYQSGDVEKAIRLSWELSHERITQINQMSAGLISDGEAAIDAEGAQADRQATISISVGVVAMIIFIMMTFLILYVAINQIGKPILQLHEAITAVGLGKFEPIMVGSLITRSDEIGRLARAVEEMGIAANSRQQKLTEQADILRARLAQIEGSTI